MDNDFKYAVGVAGVLALIMLGLLFYLVHSETEVRKEELKLKYKCEEVKK